MSNEEIKAAVLAEFERIAVERGWYFHVAIVTAIDANGAPSNEYLVRNPASLDLILAIRESTQADSIHWLVCYRLLGLGERRLAEESEALREKARLYDEAEGVLGKMIEILKRKREQGGQGNLPMADDVDKPRWIPVGESLPIEGDDVLILVMGSSIEKAARWNNNGYEGYHWHHYDVGGGNDVESRDVTHWMPLPKFEEAK